MRSRTSSRRRRCWACSSPARSPPAAPRARAHRGDRDREHRARAYEAAIRYERPAAVVRACLCIAGCARRGGLDRWPVVEGVLHRYLDGLLDAAGEAERPDTLLSAARTSVLLALVIAGMLGPGDDRRFRGHDRGCAPARARGREAHACGSGPRDRAVARDGRRRAICAHRRDVSRPKARGLDIEIVDLATARRFCDPERLARARALHQERIRMIRTTATAAACFWRGCATMTASAARDTAPRPSGRPEQARHLSRAHRLRDRRGRARCPCWRDTWPISFGPRVSRPRTFTSFRSAKQGRSSSATPVTVAADDPSRCSRTWTSSSRSARTGPRSVHARRGRTAISSAAAQRHQG